MADLLNNNYEIDIANELLVTCQMILSTYNMSTDWQRGPHQEWHNIFCHSRCLPHSGIDIISQYEKNGETRI